MGEMRFEVRTVLKAHLRDIALPIRRRAIYTTNAIESINASIRHITKNRSLFPSDDAIFKLLYLTLDNASKKWTMPIKHWKQALQQFAIYFSDRVHVDQP